MLSPSKTKALGLAVANKNIKEIPVEKSLFGM